MALSAVAMLVLFLAPPLATWARRYEYVQALQFCVFGVFVPALLVAGAPWRRLGIASRDAPVFGEDGALLSPTRPRALDRVALAHLRHSGHRRAVLAVVAFALLALGWRLGLAGDALSRHAWLAPLEAVSLLVAGAVLWLDLVESPPVSPGVPRPYRIAMATASMWIVWVFTYLVAQSRGSWYPAFHHVAGQGLSLVADQQWATGVLWMGSAIAFMPVIFWNLVHWLASEEDPDDELHRLVRDHRTFGYDVKG